MFILYYHINSSFYIDLANQLKVKLNLTNEQKKLLEKKREPKVETPNKPKIKNIVQTREEQQQYKRKKQQEKREYLKEQEKNQFNSPINTNEPVVDPKELTNKEIAAEKELIINLKQQLLQQACIVLVTCDQLDSLYGKPLSFIVQSFSMIK